MRSRVATRVSAPREARRSVSAPAVSSGPIGVAHCRRTGPLSSPGSLSMMLTPVSGSPRRIAQLIGAAPRSRGRSDACTLIIPRSGSASTAGLRMCPYATTTPRSGRTWRSAARKTSPAGRSGCSTGIRWRSATCLTGGAISVERERPCGWSGWGTTATTRAPAASRAPGLGAPAASRASRLGTAKSGVPKKTMRIGLLGAGGLRPQGLGHPFAAVLLPEARREQLAFQSAEVVEEEDAVEVVDLVLDRAGEQSARLPAVAQPVAAGRLEDDSLGALHVAVEIGNREAALFRAGAPLGLDDHGVHHGQPLALDPHHRDPLRDPDLVGREADALRDVHGLEEVVDEAPDVRIDGGHLRAALAEHRGAEEVEVEQRHDQAVGKTSSPPGTTGPRSTRSVEPPLSMVTRSSLMSLTFPMIPPEVVISSPFLSWERISLCFLRAWDWGRISRK